MIEIHQATFGEGSDRGHALLNSSYPTDTIPNQISGFTDVTDRPREGDLSHPIIRGFLTKGQFLLIKSFPDSSGRQGRVFSHALIIKEADYLQIEDLSELLQFFLPTLDKEAEMMVIPYNSGLAKKMNEPTQVELLAIDGLINHLTYDNTIVWLSEQYYWLWIGRIWRQLPDQVKRNIKIGAAFNPAKVNTSLLNLLYLPEDTKYNWLKEKFLLVDERSEDIPSSRLNKFLLGTLKKDDPLPNLLSELQPEIIEIDDLRLFDQYADVYHHIENNPLIRSLLMLSDLISKYNPVTNVSAVGKRKILNAISKAIEKATPEEIGFLQHQTLVGFEEKDVKRTIDLTLKTWLENNLLKEKISIEKSKIAVTALRAEKQNWWHILISQYIDDSFKSWNSSYSDFLWNWIKTDLNVAEQLISELLDTCEADLVATFPSLDKRSKEVIIEIVLKKKWFQLYGIIAIDLYSPKDAFSKVLSNINSQSIVHTLESMASKITSQKLLSVASELGGEQLIKIAAKKITENPGLKGGLKIKTSNSQLIWLESWKMGSDLWTGIAFPQKTLFQIMDQISEDDHFDTSLLLAISNSDYSSLKDYKKRTLIWNVLSGETKMNFLSSTLADCLRSVDSDNLKLSNLEKPLIDCLDSSQVLQKIMCDSSLTIKMKLQLFSHTTKCSEYEAELLLQSNKLSNSEAEQFGKLVLSKSWKGVVSTMYNSRQSRNDFEPALKQCYRLLSIWERLNLSITGFGAGTISEDEQWDILFEKAITNYPDGPNQNGLWENAGGKRSELQVNGSGKQIWRHAVNHIREGGHPKKKKLLAKMIEEFPHDQSLKQLNQIL